MSQSQIVKYGLIPVIVTLAVVAATPSSRKFQVDNPKTQDIAPAKPSTDALKTTNAESGNFTIKLTQVRDRFQDTLKQFVLEQSGKSVVIASKEADSQPLFNQQYAETIEPSSDFEYLAFFNLSEQLDLLQGLPSEMKYSKPEQSESLFLSLISAKTTAWKFFVREADRAIVQEVDRTASAQIESQSARKPQTNKLQTKRIHRAKISQMPKTVPVDIKSTDPPAIAKLKTATNHLSTEFSEENLLFELFGTPDSPGALAIGAAEGTRTASGEVTSSYWGHSDPGNGVNNMGTFSYQHGAPSPRQADWRQLKRLQEQVETIIKQAQEEGVTLSKLELVAGADLLNQSPAAGMSYVYHLKQVRDRGLEGINAVLEARVMSFVNPKTGVLEAGGFGNSWEILRHDQWRRLVKLNQTLQWHGVI